MLRFSVFLKRIRITRLNYEHLIVNKIMLQRTEIATLETNPTFGTLKLIILFGCFPNSVQLLKYIVIHRNSSKEPVDRDRRIARGVFQFTDQTNRKLNWVLKFDVISNVKLRQF